MFGQMGVIIQILSGEFLLSYKIWPLCKKLHIYYRLEHHIQSDVSWRCEIHQLLLKLPSRKLFILIQIY